MVLWDLQIIVFCLVYLSSCRTWSFCHIIYLFGLLHPDKCKYDVVGTHTLTHTHTQITVQRCLETPVSNRERERDLLPWWHAPRVWAGLLNKWPWQARCLSAYSRLKERHPCTHTCARTHAPMLLLPWEADVWMWGEQQSESQKDVRISSCKQMYKHILRLRSHERL